MRLYICYIYINYSCGLNMSVYHQIIFIYITYTFKRYICIRILHYLKR